MTLIVRGFLDGLLVTRGLGSTAPPPPTSSLRFDDWYSTTIDATPDPLDIDPEQTMAIN